MNESLVARMRFSNPRLLSFGLNASTATTDPEHLGPADRACSSCSRTAVLHGYLLFSLNLPFGFALHAISDSRQLGSNQMKHTSIKVNSRKLRQNTIILSSAT